MISKLQSAYLSSDALDFTLTLKLWNLELPLKDINIICRMSFRSSSGRFEDAYLSEVFTLKPGEEDEGVILELRTLLVPPDPSYLQRWLNEHPRPPDPAPWQPTPRLGLLERLFAPPLVVKKSAAEQFRLIQKGTQEEFARNDWARDHISAEIEAERRNRPSIRPMTQGLQVLLGRTEAVRKLLREWKDRPLPVRHSRLRSPRDFVYYKGSIWSSANYLTEGEWKLLSKRKVERDKAKLESIKHSATTKSFARAAIPEEVRLQVWRRDRGKCAKCGSRQNLEFDHIVPVSIGGSSTARNIELLCQDCNRAKGATVA